MKLLAISAFATKFEIKSIHIMKQKLFSAFILILFGGNLIAQESKIEFGLGTTPFISWISPSNKAISNGSASPSFGFGAKINYNIGAKYALGFEINLQNIGAQVKAENVVVRHHGINDTLSNFSITYNLQYIDIPFFIKMHTVREENRSFYGEFGASFGLLLKQKGDVNSNSYNKENINFAEPDEEDVFELKSTKNEDSYAITANKVRAGLMFGGGVNFHLQNSSRIELGIRYHMGLTDLLSENKWTANNNGIGLNIGFIF
jgi:hypothetical protein